MKKVILLYGLCGGLLIAALELAEYRFLVVEHSIEVYGGLIALVFAAVGIWLGLTRTKEVLVLREVPVPASQSFVRNDAKVAELGITPRELEILQHIAIQTPPLPLLPPLRRTSGLSSARPRRDSP